jgi:signal transduction histidine kinase
VTGWFALVALWRHRLAALIAFFAANTLVSLAVLVALGETGRLNIARFIMVSCGISILQITIFVGSKAVTATAKRGAEAEDELARTRINRLAAEAVQAARRTRYEEIRQTVVPLLEGLSGGTLDLADPAARQQVAVAITRLRRFLVENDDVPDPLLHELRACADAAERRGIAVDLVAPTGAIPALPLDIRRALTEPVIQALAATASKARVTVAASPAEVVVAVLTDAHLPVALPAMHDRVRAEHDEGGELLWVQARWTALSPSQS